jgi:hypothetical protein
MGLLIVSVITRRELKGIESQNERKPSRYFSRPFPTHLMGDDFKKEWRIDMSIVATGLVLSALLWLGALLLAVSAAMLSSQISQSEDVTE